MTQSNDTLGMSNLGPDDLRAMLRTMQTIRRFEERASDDFRAGDVYGVVHSYIGEEAVAVGVCQALRKSDKIISTHRGHGHCIAKGADLNRMMAELYGRRDGYCKGKGGSMHIADFDIGMLGANGIVAGGMPIITGAGLACQMDGLGDVAICFFGDGASNAGPFHESINLAASWKLPVIYVCENNLWAVNVATDQSTALPDIAERAKAYGIPGEVVDGNDVFAVYRAAFKAIDEARRGEGPSIIECKTYRHRAHTERPDQRDIRPEDEVAAWKAKDPIGRLLNHMKALPEAPVTDAEFQDLDKAVLTEIEAAVAFAKASPFPDPDDAVGDVFAA
ncbi:MAG: thiamine pyrophosphate-dependent dehydrogenase E1 component subunit alpha [Rhodospirillaceae bacterium]